MIWAHPIGRRVPALDFPSCLHGHELVLKMAAAAVLLTCESSVEATADRECLKDSFTPSLIENERH